MYLKISAPLSFKPVEETLDVRTMLTCLLFLYNVFLLKNLVTSAELLRADISIDMYIRLSVHLSVLLRGTNFYPLRNFHEMVIIQICFELT